jgi:hypothetical protein
MSKEIYTREEVVALLTEERTRARDIAYAFKAKHDAEVDTYKKLFEGKPEDRDYIRDIARKHKFLADEARQIGNAISGSTALTMEETIEDRIKAKLENE